MDPGGQVRWNQTRFLIAGNTKEHALLEIKKLTPHVGVEIVGLDVSKPLPDSVRDELNDALAQNGVALIRGQRLSIEQFMGFSRSIGPLAVHSLKQFSKPGFPELMVNSNIVEDGKPVGLADGGQHWHTDGAYLETPYRTTILYSVQVPVGDDGVALGDTAFASTSAAYDALPEDLKARLGGMRALHCHGVAREKYLHALDKSQSEALRKTVEHPVVRTHPVTGRKCLYVNP